MRGQRRFGKHYASLREQAFRQRQFIANAARVARSLMAFVSRRASYFLQLNRYSDLSGEELRRRLLSAKPDAAAWPAPAPANQTLALVRKRRWLFAGKKAAGDVFQIDWRREARRNESSCLQEPTDQGECGRCYADATVKLFEWLHCRQHGRPIKMSEQYLVDCGQAYELDGCESGSILGALLFVEENGLLRAEQLPNSDGEQPCRAELRQQAIWAGRIERKVSIQQERWPAELAGGPLVVYMQPSEDFIFYAGGLYEPRQCDQSLAHILLLVGLGHDHRGRPFWLLSSSSGPDYGESGYVRVPADNSRTRHNCLAYTVQVKADFRAEPATKTTTGWGGGPRRTRPHLQPEQRLGAI